MRTAILSDIHGNLEALSSVFADLDRADIDRSVSLGDMIGYGPRPSEVLDMLAARGIPSVMGNHELAIVRPVMLSWFNASARRSIEITLEHLTNEQVNSLHQLKSFISLGDLRCVHGFPPDSVTRYLFEASGAELRQTLREMAEEICFVGHTHELALISLSGDTLREEQLGEKAVILPRGARYLVNAGAVGQPRDGDNRAKYLIWDSETRTLEVRRIVYDIEKTVGEILALGLPRTNADRLR